jgi:hypothetical protein
MPRSITEGKGLDCSAAQAKYFSTLFLFTEQHKTVERQIKTLFKNRTEDINSFSLPKGKLNNLTL